MNPAEHRSEKWAREHRSPEATQLVAYRTKVCRACIRCNDIIEDVCDCASARELLPLTVTGSCPIKLW